MQHVQISGCDFPVQEEVVRQKSEGNSRRLIYHVEESTACGRGIHSATRLQFQQLSCQSVIVTGDINSKPQ